MKIKEGEMIVKVQRSMVNKGTRTLIYNEDRSLLVEFDTNKTIRRMLGLKLKAFFLADISKGNINLVKEVDWRGW